MRECSLGRPILNSRSVWRCWRWAACSFQADGPLFAPQAPTHLLQGLALVPTGGSQLEVAAAAGGRAAQAHGLRVLPLALRLAPPIQCELLPARHRPRSPHACSVIQEEVRRRQSVCSAQRSAGMSRPVPVQGRSRPQACTNLTHGQASGHHHRPDAAVGLAAVAQPAGEVAVRGGLQRGREQQRQHVKQPLWQRAAAASRQGHRRATRRAQPASPHVPSLPLLTLTTRTS